MLEYIKAPTLKAVQEDVDSAVGVTIYRDYARYFSLVSTFSPNYPNYPKCRSNHPFSSSLPCGPSSLPISTTRSIVMCASPTS